MFCLIIFRLICIYLLIYDGLNCICGVRLLKEVIGIARDISRQILL